MSADKLIFHSRLPPVALAQKMLKLIGEGKKARAVGGVIGNGSEQEMSLFVRHKGRTSAIKFKADLEADGTGTRIDGKFGTGSGLGFFKFMFVGIGSIFFLVGLGGLWSGAPVAMWASFMGVPLFQWVILFVLLKAMKVGSAADREKILAFMREHLEIEDAPPRAALNGKTLE